MEQAQQAEQPMETIDTHIAEINPYVFRMEDYPRRRLNLLLPSVNPEHVFGGISTALKFFEQLADTLGYDKRIILVDAEPSQEARKLYGDRYVFVDSKENRVHSAQILPYSQRPPFGIPLSDKDYFMFTGWWTAHCAQEACELVEKETGRKPNTFLYFIQDYEPGFYAWSSKFLLAEATYKNRYPHIAVFNTVLLQEYFHDNHYSFYREFAFDPVLNTGLKKRLLQEENSMDKKKQILVYGRPGTDRNAFTLIVAALKKWVKQQRDVEEWELLSAGEMHPPVDLGCGKQLVSVGKLTIEEYAQTLVDTFAGISLMASPHPSYPPLEMSVFGVKVITNTFANKDLRDFNENIVSLDTISPVNIASALEEICDQYRPSVPWKLTNPEYVDNEDVFGFIPEIQAVLEEEA